MSELSMIEITVSKIKQIEARINRMSSMNSHLRAEMEKLNQRLSGSLTLNASHKLLSTVENTKRIIATVNALNSSVELKPFSEVLTEKLPGINTLNSELQYMLQTRNFKGLEMREREISSMLNQTLSTVRLQETEYRKEEVKVTGDVLKQAFREIGFSSVRELKTKGGGLLLRAKNNNDFTTFFAELSPRSEIRLDTKGYTGSSCTKAVDDLLEKLHEHGIDAHRKEQIVHNRPEGGVLVAETEKFFASILDPKEKEESVRNKSEEEHRRLYALAKNKQMQNR